MAAGIDGREPLSILPARDRRDLKGFIGATRAIYAGDPNWIQPLTFERLDHLNAKKNPFMQGIEVAYWTAFRGLRPVGRISAQVNQAHLKRYADATGHFGFFECLDDEDAARLLTETAEIWLRAKGMRRVVGPLSPSINDEAGLLVEGFDTPPYLMMPHGHPFYDRLLQDLGYAKEKDLIAYDFDVTVPWPAPGLALYERLKTMPGITFRHLDMKHYKAEIHLICEIFNDAWAENWGFIPFGEAEAQYLAASIRPLVAFDMFAIGELDGEPAAMTVVLPNLNEAIRDLDGRLLPFGWAKLLWRLKVRGVKSMRMPLMGVRRRLQNTRAGAALALGVIEKVRVAARKRGIERGELSWILEDNPRVQGLIETVGGRPYKTYRLYAKPLL